MALQKSAVEAADTAARMQTQNEKIGIKDVEEALTASNAKKLKRESDYNKKLIELAKDREMVYAGEFSYEKKTAKAIAAEQELATRRASSDIYISSADYIEEAKDDLEKTIKLGIEANQIIK